MRILLLLLLTAACGSTSESRKNLNEVYQGAGVEQYFLSELPDWANFTTLASCHRDRNIRFLNFQNLHASYALDYEQSVQLQYMVNRGLQRTSFESGKKVFNNEDESFIFYKSYEQIIGGSREFIQPQYERVHVIWVDDAIKNSEGLNRVKQLMESSQMEKGHPVFFSMCLSYNKLESFIIENGFQSYGVKFISMEMLSPYASDLQLLTYFDLSLENLMPNKNVYFFVPFIPEQYKNKKNIIKY